TSGTNLSPPPHPNSNTESPGLRLVTSSIYFQVLVSLVSRAKSLQFFTSFSYPPVASASCHFNVTGELDSLIFLLCPGHGALSLPVHLTVRLSMRFAENYKVCFYK